MAGSGKEYKSACDLDSHPISQRIVAYLGGCVHDWGVLNFGVIWLTEMRGAESAEDM
jgi:hypothetical protein